MSDHRHHKHSHPHHHDGSEKNESKSFYEDHFGEDELAEGVRNGTILIGTLSIYARKRKIAYVKIPGNRIDVFIQDEQSRNRAHHGDKVYVKLLPERLWSNELDDTEAKPSSGIVEPLDNRMVDVSELPSLWNVKTELLVPAAPTTSSAATTKSTTDEAPVSPLDTAARRVGKQPSGVVVGILSKSHKLSLVGSLRAQCALTEGKPLPSTALVFFLPTDKKYADMIIPRTELPDAYVHDPLPMQARIYVADIDPEWNQGSKCPFGSNVRDIGAIGSIYSETEAILTEYGINHPPYVDPSILKGVISDDVTELSGWTIPSEEIAKRRDLRSYRIFTIDPYNARDLDDALHITELEDGTFEIGVHIADVSYFVKDGIPLDIEAQRRATSIYLVQKVIPMLPPILCEQLCSLNPNVDRLAFSCIWRMNADGTLCNHPTWYGKTVIRSCAKLDYATAQRMADRIIPSDPSSELAGEDSITNDIWEFARRPGVSGVESSEFPVHKNWEVARDVTLLHRVAMNRRALRLQSGALTLNNPKVTFILDDQGNPSSLGTYTIRETNQMVEEYMLLANYFVAEQLTLKCRSVAFLRRHAAPDHTNKKIADISAVTDGMGIYVDINTGKTIQSTLDAVREASGVNGLLVVEALLMRIMTLAEYFVIDHSDSATWRHFALGIPYYTHFTSPIRRYADIIVHRLLFSVLDDSNPPLYDESSVTKLSELAKHCNVCKKSAKDAEVKCDNVFMAVFLLKNPCVEEAFVIGIGKKSFTLLVYRFGIESRVFTDDLHGVEAGYDSSENKLVLVNKRKPQEAQLMATEDDLDSHILQFDRLDVALMIKVRVYMSAVTHPHLDVKISLVGPA